MRVIVVADYAIAEGGAPQVAIASALGLAALGIDVVFVHGVGAAADAALIAEPRIRRVALGGQDIWNKGFLQAARDGVWNREHLAPLRRLLAEFDPADTIVHVHQWTKYFSPSVFAAIRAQNLPLAISLHDYFLACPTGLKYLPRRGEPCALKPLSAACLVAPCDPRTPLHKAVRVVRTIAGARALRGYPFTAIHVSEVGRRTLAGCLPAGAEEVVLENPVECENHGPRGAPSANKVAYCGRLTEDKGADLVAQAARAQGLPSLFVGDGPLRERILAIDPKAEITGWLDKAAARERIAQEALALVAPSRWPETGPLVAAEAMADGVPVIVSERAGAAGRIEDGKTGLIVAPDAEAIGAALARLRAPGAAQAMGEAGYKAFWSDPPSLESHATKLAAIYRATIERRQRG